MKYIFRIQEIFIFLQERIILPLPNRSRKSDFDQNPILWERKGRFLFSWDEFFEYEKLRIKFILQDLQDEFGVIGRFVFVIKGQLRR